MILRRLLTITILLTSTIWSQAQQINPVPDYVFRNQMSVGRNAVTDTAAYFSIGPRYGATKGFMPPIVGDTATFSSGKRNGLLIFSVQKNKFLYWDSVRVQWSDMAGGSGSYILAGDTASMLSKYLRKSDTTAMLSPYYRSATASAALALKLNISDTSSMLANYVRHAGYGLTKSGQSFLVDTLNIATRAWRQKGLDSLAALEVSGSGTTNYVPKFTAGSTIGNSQIFDNGTNVGIGTASPLVKLDIVGSSGTVVRTKGGTGSAQGSAYYVQAAGSSNTLSAFGDRANIFGGTVDQIASVYTGSGIPLTFDVGNTERLRITSDGNVGIGATGSLLPLTVYNPTLNTPVLEVRGGGGSSQTRINLSYGNTTSTTLNGDIFASTTDFALRAQAGRNMWFGTDAVSGSTNRMQIFANGRVFIGASPTDAGYQLDINGTLRSVNGANFATTSGNVGIGTTTINAKLHVLSATGTAQSLGDWANNIAIIQGASRTGTTAVGGSFATTLSLQSNDDVITAGSGASVGFSAKWNSALYGSAAQFASIFGGKENGSDASLAGYLSFATRPAGGNPTERGRINSAGEWIIDASGTDAGDYKLQVVGNARIGTGKLDIASNTTFGLGVARSGTSEVAGQIYNSSGILYFGAESSAGGQIFSGSSAYAAVIGSGANYPLQFAANNITRATLTTNGNFMIGFPTDTYFYRLQVNGSIFSNNQIIAQNAAAQLNIDSSTNISPLYISNQSLTGSSAQGLFYGSTTWNTTGNPSLIDLAITNTASGSDANYIKISDGSNIFRVTKAAEVVTAAPTGGSIRKWKLGEAATVSPTSPNRTIRVEIDGTVYYLHAKTTND